mmetsp:Transcript_24404/g.39181  ORF Transcript_24404/g.39181 Transcript_24404/m.39181 type:complete len:339 (+) Transcript_24404:177-1193(+)
MISASALAMFLQVCSIINSFIILAVIIVMATVKKLQSLFAFRIISFLALNDLCAYIVFAFGNMAERYGESSFGCQFQAFGLNYFFLSAWCWANATAYTLNRVIDSATTLKPLNIGPTTMRYFILMFQILPVFPSVMPFFFDAYGNSGAWCWVKADTENINYEVIRLCADYLFGYITLGYCIYTYISVWRRLRGFQEQNSNAASNILSGSFRVLKYYPLITIWVLSFPSLNRFIGIFSVKLSWLTMMHAICVMSMGPLDALMFFINPTVQRELKQFLQQKCGVLLPKSLEVAILQSSEPLEISPGEQDSKQLNIQNHADQDIDGSVSEFLPKSEIEITL